VQKAANELEKQCKNREKTVRKGQCWGTEIRQMLESDGPSRGSELEQHSVIMTACLIFSKIPTLLERRYGRLTGHHQDPGG
jgi:hypothetical protein